jgi:hypothetical protein
VAIILRSLIILGVLILISLWLSIAPIYIFLLLIATLGLWHEPSDRNDRYCVWGICAFGDNDLVA